MQYANVREAARPGVDCEALRLPWRQSHELAMRRDGATVCRGFDRARVIEDALSQRGSARLPTERGTRRPGKLDVGLGRKGKALFIPSGGALTAQEKGPEMASSAVIGPREGYRAVNEAQTA